MARSLFALSADLVEGWIPAEQLVAAETRDSHLETQFMARLADEPGVDAIDRRLVHRCEDLRKILCEFALRDDAIDVPGAEAARNLVGKRRLVLGAASELLERERHGLDVLLARIPHQSDKGTGVDACREERADGDISHQMVAHAIEQRVTDSLQHVRASCSSSIGLRRVVDLGDREVPHGRMGADGIHTNYRPGRQRADQSICRIRLGNAAEEIEPDVACRIGIAGTGSSGQKCLNLRGEPQCPPIVCVIERLDPIGISGKQQSAAFLCPKLRTQTSL